MWRRLAVIGGLGALAFVAPLLDLYGKNPEVFVANRTNVAEIVAFAVGVALLIPLFAWAVLAIAGEPEPARAEVTLATRRRVFLSAVAEGDDEALVSSVVGDIAEALEAASAH